MIVLKLSINKNYATLCHCTDFYKTSVEEHYQINSDFYVGFENIIINRLESF